MKNTKKLPYLSIVVLNYNGLKYFKKTIPPILKLDYPNYEFVIVDNGSTDRSIQFIKKFKRIKLIENKKNLGYSEGKNIGVKKAKGEYILLLDNDILINNKEKFIKNLIKNYNKKTAFIQVLFRDYNKIKTKYYGVSNSCYGANLHKKEISFDKFLDSGKEFIEINSPCGGCIFFKKEKWLKVGGFDASQKFNLDDLDIGSRAIIQGYKNYLYTNCCFLHLGVNKTKEAEEYSKRFKFLFSGHARSMIKNYKFENLIWNFPLLCLFQFLKTIKYSFEKRSLKVFEAFLWSVKVFLRNLSDTLNQRKIIQSKRVVKKDVFLKIKPPKFD